MKPATREWADKAENDFIAAGQLLRRRKHVVTDSACFHCQQCVEKYLKARRIKAGLPFPRTHDLGILLSLCGRVEPLGPAYSQIADALSDYAVDFRYPGHSTTLAEARQALKQCRVLRAEIRHSLGMKV